MRSQLSPYLHAPILQKNGQLTLSISVPQTLARRSAISVIFIIELNLNQANPIQQLMTVLVVILTLFIAASQCFTITPMAFSTSIIFQNKQDAMVSQQIKYNGKGFEEDLQSAFNQAIQDSAIFFKQKYFYQANYISRALQKVKPGDWNVFVIQNINITRITEISTGFSFWSDTDTWALWYSISSYMPKALHLAIYSGNSQKQSCEVTTAENSVGKQIDNDKAAVISSTVTHLDTAQDIGRALQKFDGQKWSVISIPMIYSGLYPEAYAKLSSNEQYVSYHANVTMMNIKYSQIIYA